MTISITITNDADPSLSSPALIVSVQGPSESSDAVLPAGVPYQLTVDAVTKVTLSQRGEDQVVVPASRLAALEQQVADLQAVIEASKPTPPIDPAVEPAGG